MKKFRLVMATIIVGFAMVLMAGCGSGDQPDDIAGTYEGGAEIYTFAEDGTMSYANGVDIKYGYYQTNSGVLIIQYEGENVKYDYTLDGTSLSLFKKGSIFGATYELNGDAVKTISSFIEPETVALTADELKLLSKEDIETTVTKASESENITAVSKETTKETSAETTTKNSTETTTEEPASEEIASEEVWTEDVTPAQPETEEIEETAAETEAWTEPETTTEETTPETTTTEETTTAEPFVNRIVGTVAEGNTVRYGTYEQDNNWDNGQEDIEWIILKIDGNKALLLSKYGLDTYAYKWDGSWVTWEDSDVRTWLNNEFAYYAFTEDEMKNILTTSITPDTNPDYETVDAGYGSEDKIFLLSTNQAWIYFSSKAARACEPTAYCLSKGLADDGDGYWWWLRTPGENSGRAAGVYANGTIDYKGAGLGQSGNMIRPAMWVRYK